MVPGALVAVPLGLSVITPIGVIDQETELYAPWAQGMHSASVIHSAALQPHSVKIVMSTIYLFWLRDGFQIKYIITRNFNYLSNFNYIALSFIK